MTQLKVKQALVQQLIDSLPTGLDPSSDIAYENGVFDPKGKSLWLACYFLPATEDTMGKTLSSGDDNRGVFQVSVFVNKNNKDYDNTQLNTIDVIKSGFAYSTSTTYEGQKVDILNSSINNGRESESWFQRDISIDYMAFISRDGAVPIIPNEPFNFQNGDVYTFQDETDYIFN